nr:MFS transporter [Burkholderiales bacterium]
NLSFAIKPISKDFSLSSIQSGFLLAAWMWPYAIANLPSGWLIDKFGINKVFIWSIMLWSISTILSGVITNYQELYLSRVALGIAEAPFFIIGAKIIQLYFTHHNRGLVSGIINLGPKIANGFAPPLIAILIITTSWRVMFIILGVLGFVIAFLWIKIYQPNFSSCISYDLTKYNKKIKFSLWKLINHKTTWWLNLGNLGSSYVFWLYFTWLPTYLIDNRGLNLKATGGIAALPFIAGAIAVPFGGYLSDMLIKKYNVSTIRARVIPASLGCLIAGISVIPINYVNNLSIAIILFTISTFAVSFRVGVLWALASEISPPTTVGTLGGIQNAANFIGGALAPTISGIIIQYTANYNIVFGISGLLVILAAICYTMIKSPILIEEISNLK